MNRLLWHVILAVAALSVATSNLYAQTTTPPHIGYVYPTGGLQGTSFEVVVGGQFIKETTETYLSGGGVSFEFVKHYKPLSQGENTKLRLRLLDARQKLEAKNGEGSTTPEMVAQAAGVTEYDLQEMEVYKKRRADPKRQPNCQIEEEVTLKVAVDADAEPGTREFRIITPNGMSNPIWFQVGLWEDRYETEPNDVEPDPTIGATLPVVVNGQIMPGDVDRFSFTATKGTKLVISADARGLMPYLADAVPGWFQAVLVLYDGDGNELQYAGAYYYRQDPVIYYEVPEDGKYSIEIRDSIYRGREDFVYRITLGELPFVTGIFPLGARPGTDVQVELQGWNLVETKLNVRAVLNRNRPVRWYEIPQTEKVSIRFPLQMDLTSEIADLEPNDRIEEAQAVNLPVIVNGRIGQPNDRDLFTFDAHGKLLAEVYARRAGSPLDSSLLLLDAEGKEVGFSDDYRDDAYPLITHHADSRLAVMLPGTGPYTLHLTDSQRNGGEDFIYRLYIRPPAPDFDLRVVPSCIIARPGSTVPLTMHAFRDHYEGDIEFSLVDPPAGFELGSPILPGGSDKTRITLTVPPTAAPEPVILEMDGNSVRDYRQRLKISRPVVPAESMMQAFLWLQVVPAEQWSIVVSGKPAQKIPLEFPVTGERVMLNLGGETIFPAKLTAKNPPAKELKVELSEPPAGISVKKTEVGEQGIAVVLETDAETVTPGLRENLIFEVYREWTQAATDTNPQPKEKRMSLGFLPAIPIEVNTRAVRK